MTTCTSASSSQSLFQPSSPLAKLGSHLFARGDHLTHSHSGRDRRHFPELSETAPKRQTWTPAALAEKEWDAFNAMPGFQTGVDMRKQGQLHRQMAARDLEQPTFPSSVAGVQLGPRNMGHPVNVSDLVAWSDEFGHFEDKVFARTGNSVAREDEVAQLGGARDWVSEHMEGLKRPRVLEREDNDVDEWSQEWSNEALTEQARRAHREFTSVWTGSIPSASSPHFGELHETTAAYVHLTNALFHQLGARLRSMSFPEPEPIEMEMVGTKKCYGHVLGQGGRRASTHRARRTASEWDHGAELLDEADRWLSGEALRGDFEEFEEIVRGDELLSSSSSSSSSAPTNRMFVKGSWDWERVFGRAFVAPDDEETESADTSQVQVAALRRLRSLLTHVGASKAGPAQAQAQVQHKDPAAHPIPRSHLARLSLHALDNEAIDLGKLKLDMDRYWAGKGQEQEQEQAAIDRGGSPDSFDSAGL